MNKTTLYKLDSKGKMRQWSISVVSNSVGANGEAGIIFIETGLVEGKKVTQEIIITEGKNLGKANATTPYTQALSEAEAKLELQLRSGYVRNIEEVKESGTLGSGLKSPMLAVTFDPEGKRKNSKTLKQLGLDEDKEVGLQAKLDGNRMLVVITKDSIASYTRKGDIMPIQPKHILDSLRVSYNESNYTHEDVVIIDGEIMHPSMTFNESNGLLKRFKNSSDEKILEGFVYYIYDLVMDAPYKVRNNILSFFKDDKNVILLNTEYVKATNKILRDRLSKFVSEGKEGIIIRNLDLPYEHKRSKGLIKYKDFLDSEFKLVGMEEDARGGFVGNFILAMDEFSVNGKGKPIKTFKAGTTGMSQEELTKIWKERERYINTLCTVEYFERSEYNVPRFGKVKELNRTDV